jgi:hypothetical protein
MDATTLAWVLVIAGVIWMIQLVWLYWQAENRHADPIRIVSGAATFFVAAAPVAILAPEFTERVGDFWDRAVGAVFGDRSNGDRAPRTPARLLINGEARPLTIARLRLGRYPNNDIVLDHSTVSAYHAEIIQRPDGRHEIIDRESRNGTRVNGALVRSQVLRDGDLVTLGAASLHYLSESATDPRASMPSEYDGRADRDPRAQQELVDDEYVE